jgi:hypothetical protein
MEHFLPPEEGPKKSPQLSDLIESAKHIKTLHDPHFLQLLTSWHLQRKEQSKWKPPSEISLTEDEELRGRLELKSQEYELTQQLLLLDLQERLQKNPSTLSQERDFADLAKALERFADRKVKSLAMRLLLDEGLLLHEDLKRSLLRFIRHEKFFERFSLILDSRVDEAVVLINGYNSGKQAIQLNDKTPSGRYNKGDLGKTSSVMPRFDGTKSNLGLTFEPQRPRESQATSDSLLVPGRSAIHALLQRSTVQGEELGAQRLGKTRKLFADTTKVPPPLFEDEGDDTGFMDTRVFRGLPFVDMEEGITHKTERRGTAVRPSPLFEVGESQQVLVEPDTVLLRQKIGFIPYVADEMVKNAEVEAPEVLRNPQRVVNFHRCLALNWNRIFYSIDPEKLPSYLEPLESEGCPENPFGRVWEKWTKNKYRASLGESGVSFRYGHFGSFVKDALLKRMSSRSVRLEDNFFQRRFRKHEELVAEYSIEPKDPEIENLKNYYLELVDCAAVMNQFFKQLILTQRASAKGALSDSRGSMRLDQKDPLETLAWAGSENGRKLYIEPILGSHFLQGLLSATRSFVAYSKRNLMVGERSLYEDAEIVRAEAFQQAQAILQFFCAPRQGSLRIDWSETTRFQMLGTPPSDLRDDTPGPPGMSVDRSHQFPSVGDSVILDDPVL